MSKALKIIQRPFRKWVEKGKKSDKYSSNQFENQNRRRICYTVNKTAINNKQKSQTSCLPKKNKKITHVHASEVFFSRFISIYNAEAVYFIANSLCLKCFGKHTNKCHSQQCCKGKSLLSLKYASVFFSVRQFSLNQFELRKTSKTNPCRKINYISFFLNYKKI